MKVVLGTSNVSGTDFSIQDKVLLRKLWEKDKDLYFDEVEADADFIEKFRNNGGVLWSDETQSLWFFNAYKNEVRVDPYFISLLEDVGVENIGTDFGKNHLRIIEIPDGTNFYIYRPDVGAESIHEEHNVWGWENSQNKQMNMMVIKSSIDQ